MSEEWNAPGVPESRQLDDDVERSDADLLDRCRAGDATAWKHLVTRYERLVFSVAIRNGLRREDARDVSQMTFSVLLTSIADIRNDERLASWLMTVARRQSWAHRRASDHERSAVDELTRLEPADDPAVERWHRELALHQALHQLGNNCRELLEALYFDNEHRSYADVARARGWAIGTIGPARARCLRRLRKLLEDGHAT